MLTSPEERMAVYQKFLLKNIPLDIPQPNRDKISDWSGAQPLRPGAAGNMSGTGSTEPRHPIPDAWLLSRKTDPRDEEYRRLLVEKEASDENYRRKRILDQHTMDSRTSHEAWANPSSIDPSGSNPVESQDPFPPKRCKLPTTPTTDELHSRITGYHIPTIAATIQELLSKNLMSEEFVKQYGNPVVVQDAAVATPLVRDSGPAANLRMPPLGNFSSPQPAYRREHQPPEAETSIRASSSSRAPPENTLFRPAPARPSQELHSIPATTLPTEPDTFTPEEDALWSLRARFLADREASYSMRVKRAAFTNAYWDAEASSSAYRDAEAWVRPPQGDREPAHTSIGDNQGHPNTDHKRHAPVSSTTSSSRVAFHPATDVSHPV